MAALLDIKKEEGAITPTIEGKKKRLFFLDWLRVLAFGYLIFFHTGMLYSPWGWHIKSTEKLEALTPFMMTSHEWRLQLLFFVSGAAIAFMVHKSSSWEFTKARFVKLFIPLLFGLFIIVAPQPYYEVVLKHGFSGGFWDFWTNHYLVADQSFDISTPLPTYNHMWYIAYLWIYSLVLLPIFKMADSEKGKLVVAKMGEVLSKGSRVIWAPAVPIVIATYFLRPLFPESMDIINDWASHTINMMIIVLGFLFVRTKSPFDAAENNRFIALGIAAILTATLIGGNYLPKIGDYHLHSHYYLWQGLLMWSTIVALMGFAKHYLDRPSPTIDYCNRAIYPFFILHQTVIIMLAWQVMKLGLNGWVEFFVVSFGTFGISWVLYEGLIRHFNPLRLIFGMPLRPKTKIRILDQVPAE